MNLSPCKICGGKVYFCEMCDGCHLIVCSDCKATFDLGGCVTAENADTIEELRQHVAEIWNRQALQKPLDVYQLDALRQADNGKLNFVTMREFAVIARAVEKALEITG